MGTSTRSEAVGVIVDRAIVDTRPQELYEIVKLRLSIFGSEQGIDWSVDLDDRDLESETRHIWIDVDGRVSAYLRLTKESTTQWKLGRVCTYPDYRGRGLASRLNRYAVKQLKGYEIRITAEAHLENWYEGFGFRSTGDSFELAGIKHVEMLRSAA